MTTRSSIDSPAKRGRLPSNKNPYWHPIGAARGGLYLGYRKPQRGRGTWVAKFVKDGQRAEERIGPADDRDAAPDAISFAAAIKKALEWSALREREFEVIAGGDPGSAAVSVRDAIEGYILSREARGPTARDARSRLTLHALSDQKFANTRLSKLSAAVLIGWRGRLSTKLKPTTVNRLLNDVRAALNAAIDKHRVSLHHIREEVRFGTKALSKADRARERQVLTSSDVCAITNAAFTQDETGDLGRLVLVMAATGARFSQIARLRVRDVQIREKRIMMPVSAKGNGSKAQTHVPVPIGEDVIEHLHPAIAGRKGIEALLERWRHLQTGPAEWVRDSRGAWKTAAELTRPWKRIVASAGLPADTIPYALRHTSIVRMLRKNISTRFVALAHDTSVAMIEKHYAAFILDDVSDIVRRAVEPVMGSKVSRLTVVASGTET